MVCIAAFIILALIGGVVAIISIFKPEVGKRYLKIFKKAWGCLWKKVRLQKCETGFKDDVKNTLLSPVIVRHPKWVKPLSVLIEVLSVAIVAVAVWAIVTAVKALLALAVFGTCNVSQPAACTLGNAEVCSIDEDETDGFFEGIGRWFSEWGEIFAAIPDKFKTYNAEDYEFNYVTISEANASGSEGSGGSDAVKPIAVDIFDPGCPVCLRSYVNQKNAGFFEEYDVRLVPYAISSNDGKYKFKNSEIIVKYMLAVEQVHSGMAAEILDRVFTWKDGDGVLYQTVFNAATREEAVAILEGWLTEMGLNKAEASQVREIAAYPEVADKMSENREIVESVLNAKGIPTMIFDGKRHTGLWETE